MWVWALFGKNLTSITQEIRAETCYSFCSIETGSGLESRDIPGAVKTQQHLLHCWTTSTNNSLPIRTKALLQKPALLFFTIRGLRGGHGKQGKSVVGRYGPHAAGTMRDVAWVLMKDENAGHDGKQ